MNHDALVASKQSVLGVLVGSGRVDEVVRDRR
jgi:hypothetical protein